jgi:tRNA dimethylallyltransferase
LCPKKKNIVVIVCGPTAVGKTAVAIELANYFQTQIISADSRQCFNELNIGVAKPSLDELNSVTHHFINSHSIHENVNAGVFETYALNAANEIFQHKNIAVMVGGTGLYIKSFCEGMDAMPAIDVSIREKIKHQYESNGLLWLQEQLQLKDPVFWQTAEQQNPQRLMRALEIVEATGQSNIDFRKGDKHQRNFDIIKIGLTLPREMLYTRINNRVDAMMEQGLLKEAEYLIPHKSLNALQTVGYKEFFNYFDGICTLENAIDELKKNTRHYAKRQMTWFKKDEAVQWFQPNETAEIIVDLVSKTDRKNSN